MPRTSTSRRRRTRAIGIEWAARQETLRVESWIPLFLRDGARLPVSR